MWKELIRVDVQYADLFMPRPISVWARIDYQEKDGRLEHSFQFGTLREGDWVPLRYFSAPRLQAMKKAIQLTSVLSSHLLLTGIGDDPERARAEYERICAEAREQERREREQRKQAPEDGLMTFLVAFLGMRSAQPEPEVVADSVAEEAPRKKIEKKAEAALASPGLGTLGDRARMRPLKSKHP